MKKLFSLSAFLFSFFTQALLQAQTIRYVRPTATGSGNGSNWNNASSDLQAMINASSNGDQVWVAAGTYKPTTGTDRTLSFSMKDGVAIYGGFPNDGSGTLTNRNPVANETILSGDIGNLNDMTDNSYNVIANGNSVSNTAVLDGFTITAGRADGLIVRTYSGGGIFNDGRNGFCSPVVRNCIFRSNEARIGGAVAGNGEGGNCSPSFTNCVFVDNKAIHNGLGSRGGAAWFQAAGMPVFNNCTFRNNQALGTGGAFYLSFNSGTRPNVTLTNCILWGNNAPSGSQIDNYASTVNIAYTTLQGGFAAIGNSQNGVANDQGNNSTADPLFVNAAAGDLRLQPCSPAINAGNNSAVPGGVIVDVAGNPRIQQTTVDMGAYESPYNTLLSPSTFGDNQWNVYAWNAGGSTFTGNTNVWNTNYSGYYTTTSLNFNSENDWNQNNAPSSATNYQGCTVGNDNFSFAAKRRGFSCGYYRLDIPGHDDGAQLWVNGSMVWSEDGYNPATTTNAWTGWLGATSTVELKITEGGGGAFGKLNFVNLAGNNGNPADFGNNTWNVYVWNAGGANFNGNINAWNTNYAGYYTDNNLNLNTENSWNQYNSPSEVSGYVGCTVQNDNFSFAAKRRGFSCGYYRLDIPGHDDGAQLWVNGNMVWSEDGYNPATTTNVWTGWLGATSTVELKITEGSGGAFGKLNFQLLSDSIVYVDSSKVAGLNNGSNWVNAYTKLQDALSSAQANSCIKEIWVAKGTYKPTADTTGNTSPSDNRRKTFVMKAGVKIYGSFAGGEQNIAERTPAVMAANPSILSGDLAGNDSIIGSGTTLAFYYNSENSYHVIYNNLNGLTTTNSLLDGFTITGGNANSYNVLYGIYGGGMYNNGSSPMLSNVSFSGNHGIFGGAVNNKNSSPRFSNVTFSANSGGNGAAVHNDNSNSILTNIFFTGNSGEYGGGMYNYYSAPNIYNVTFSGNSVLNYGGAIINDHSSLSLTNVTFWENSTVQFGGGMINFSSTASVKNCIFWGNKKAGSTTVKGADIENYSSSSTVSNTLLQLTNTITNYPTTGNDRFVFPNVSNVLFGQDPLFANAANPAGADGIFGTADDGLALKACSPAINAGDTMGISATTDIVGNPRFYNTIIDIGAYEYQDGPKPTTSDTTVSICNKYTWNGTVYKASGDYTWTGKNAAGCDSTATLHLTILAVTSTYTKTDVSCFGNNNGSITVNPTFGVSPFTYRIGTVGAYGSTNTFTNLKPGKYRVSILDVNGCAGISDQVTIVQSSAIGLNINKTNVTCYLRADGSITANGTGGNTPYQYRFGTAGTFSTTNRWTGLAPGVYSVLVKDANGCTAIGNTTIAQPTTPVSATFTKTDESCPNAKNGSIVINTTGGTAPYKYRLGTVGSFVTSNTFNNLKAGTYRVFVNDNGNCTGYSIGVVIGQTSPTCTLSTRSIVVKPEAPIQQQGLTIQLSPNPSNSYFTLQVKTTAQSTVQLRVIDVNGRSLFTAKGLPEQVFRFGETFTPGVYMIEVRQGETLKTLKAIKMRK